MPDDTPDLFGAPAAPDTPPPPPVRPPALYHIPCLASGQTRRDWCSAPTCGAVMYWVEGLRMPLSVSADGCEAPTQTASGTGISHFIDCAARQQFSGQARRGTARRR